MSAADAAARMLTLVPWLLERPGASLRETADAFGVDEATVREDLGHLDFCGLPGYGGGDLFEVHIVGDRVVVRMADELRRPLRLTPREALRLVLTVDAVADAFGDDLPALRSAVDKVRAGAGVPPGAVVELDPDGSRWLVEVRRALREGSRLRLLYHGRNDVQPVERQVDPWALVVREGAWYLQGHDHGADDRRTFRLDRVQSATVTGEPITRPRPDHDLTLPRYEPAPDDVEVELVLEPGARWIAESVVPDEVEELDRGRRRVRFRTDALPWVARLVLMAGGTATVAGPPELRDEVATRAREALARYET